MARARPIVLPDADLRDRRSLGAALQLRQERSELRRRFADPGPRLGVRAGVRGARDPGEGGPGRPPDPGVVADGHFDQPVAPRPGRRPRPAGCGGRRDLRRRWRPCGSRRPRGWRLLPAHRADRRHRRQPCLRRPRRSAPWRASCPTATSTKHWRGRTPRSSGSAPRCGATTPRRSSTWPELRLRDRLDQHLPGLPPHVPFGGMRESGFGQENGFAAVGMYTRRKAVVWDLTTDRHLPYSD